MRRVAKPLEAMGARVELPAHGGLPMTIHGGALHGIDWIERGGERAGEERDPARGARRGRARRR